MVIRRPLSRAAALALAGALAQWGCAREEECDWEDDDRDGIIDEGFDSDADGYWACAIDAQQAALGLADCDDADGGIHPGAAEGCDGLDDDCDGVVDDGCSDVVLRVGMAITQMHPFLTADGMTGLVLLAGKGGSQRVSLLSAAGDGAWALVSDGLFEGYVILDVGAVSIVSPSRIDLIGLMGYGLVPLIATLGGDVEPDVDGWAPLWFDGEGQPQMSSPSALLPGDHAAWEEDLVLATGRPGPAPLTTWVATALELEAAATLGWPQADGALVGARLADLDGDGAAEIVLAAGSTLAWHTASPTASPRTGSQALDDAIGGLTTADVDGDGDVDVLVTVPSRWRVYLLRNDGAGRLGSAEEVPQPVRHPQLIESVDLGADGVPDVVLSDADEPQLQLLSNDGAGAFSEACVEPTGDGLRVLTVPPSGDAVGATILTGHEDGTVRQIRAPCGAP